MPSFKQDSILCAFAARRRQARIVSSQASRNQ